MHPYDPLDVTPTPEQEEARLALWRRADRLARDTLPGTPPGTPLGPPTRPRPTRGEPRRRRRWSRGGHPGRHRVVTPPTRRSGGRRLTGPRIAAFGLLLVVVSIATCSVGVEPARMMSEYGEPVPASSEVARDVFARGSSALHDLPESGELRVTLTEAEVTSALGLGLTIPDLLRVMRSVQPGELEGTESFDEIRRRLRTRLLAAEAAEATPTSWTGRLRVALDPSIGIEDAQVRFSDSGEVVFAGSIRVWDWRQPALLAVAPRVDQGELRLELHRAQLGRLPAPLWLHDRLERALSPDRVLGMTITEISQLSITEDSVRFEGWIR